ncbi:hypothetical protein AB0K00_40395 [Dactylosporangium sp. NPDC049525]|uniref:hypothetical protein n=1 Tax=Dactylosporangium sp. NPDC049525 TaxID=3154730 RepID=UPI00343D4D34
MLRANAAPPRPAAKALDYRQHCSMTAWVRLSSGSRPQELFEMARRFARRSLSGSRVPGSEARAGRSDVGRPNSSQRGDCTLNELTSTRRTRRLLVASIVASLLAIALTTVGGAPAQANTTDYDGIPITYADVKRWRVTPIHAFEYQPYTAEIQIPSPDCYYGLPGIILGCQVLPAEGTGVTVSTTPVCPGCTGRNGVPQYNNTVRDQVWTLIPSGKTTVKYYGNGSDFYNPNTWGAKQVDTFRIAQA